MASFYEVVFGLRGLHAYAKYLLGMGIVISSLSCHPVDEILIDIYHMKLGKSLYAVFNYKTCHT